MGRELLEFGDVFVRRVAGGGASGLKTPQPAIVITTMPRARNEDYIVLTLGEAAEVAKAILANLAEE